MNWQPDAPLSAADCVDALILGLGGNLGTDAELQQRFAVVAEAMTAWGHVSRSSLYRSAAVDGPGPDYLNTALALRPHAPILPIELLDFISHVERRLGRDRAQETARNQPRAIDIDILLWGQRQVSHSQPSLTIPHPRLTQRRFALVPLVDLVGPDFLLPTGLPLSRALDTAPPAQVERLP